MNLTRIDIRRNTIESASMNRFKPGGIEMPLFCRDLQPGLQGHTLFKNLLGPIAPMLISRRKVQGKEIFRS